MSEKWRIKKFILKKHQGYFLDEVYPDGVLMKFLRILKNFISQFIAASLAVLFWGAIFYFCWR